MGVPRVEVMVPQHHQLGEEAEVDFGSASDYLAGALVEVSMYIMLSASGRGYARAYLNEAQEVFLDGHVRAFERSGGVPRRIRYENVPRNILVDQRGEHATEERPRRLTPRDHRVGGLAVRQPHEASDSPAEPAYHQAAGDRMSPPLPGT